MTDTITMLATKQLVPAKDNPRQALGDVDELAASMKSVGILEPLVVTPNGAADKYTIVCGHRRHAAAKKAKLAEVPCIVRELDDAGRREAMAVENLQRQDLTPLDEARAFQQLVDLGYSQRKIAERVGVGQPHISKRLKLLTLPEDAQKALVAEKITIETALELTKLADHPERVSELVGRRRVDAHRVQAEIEAVAFEQLAEAERNRAAKEGWPVVDEPFYSDKSVRKLRVGNSYGHGIEIDASNHRPEPCHAVYVGREWKSGGGSKAVLVEVCTDPKRHTKKGASELKAKADKGPMSKHERDEQHRRHGKKVAANRRTEFIADAIPFPQRGLTSTGILGGVLVDALIDQVHVEVQKAACQFLQQDPIEERMSWGDTRKDWAETLRRFLSGGSPAAGAGRLAEVATALVCAVGHQRARDSWSGWGEQGVLRLYDMLERAGYELDPFERSELDKARKELAGEKVDGHVVGVCAGCEQVHPDGEDCSTLVDLDDDELARLQKQIEAETDPARRVELIQERLDLEAELGIEVDDGSAVGARECVVCGGYDETDEPLAWATERICVACDTRTVGKKGLKDGGAPCMSCVRVHRETEGGCPGESECFWCFRGLEEDGSCALGHELPDGGGQGLAG